MQARSKGFSITSIILRLRLDVIFQRASPIASLKASISWLNDVVITAFPPLRACGRFISALDVMRDTSCLSFRSRAGRCDSSGVVRVDVYPSSVCLSVCRHQWHFSYVNDNTRIGSDWSQGTSFHLFLHPAILVDSRKCKCWLINQHVWWLDWGNLMFI